MYDYKHEPLAAPSRQIRLLQLPATRWGDGMHLQLSTWDFTTAPPYTAISYTWGPAGYPTRTLSINGLDLEVRRKCRFALLQARLHCPGEYVWIDSICIDQSNVNEKNVQVAMMFDIYKQAKQVLACIGESSESSRRLSAVANVLGYMRKRHNLFQDLVAIPQAPGALMSLPLITILRGLGEGVMHQLNDDLTAMSERGYWHRLWIVQEIAAGQEKVQILCGTDMLSPTGLHLLTRHLDGPGYYRDPSSRLLDQIVTSTAYTRLSARSLDDIFTDFANALCSDARDKIYGVLGLVDWKRYGLESMVPDYSISLWILALQLIKYTPRLSLLWALEISADTPEMQELIHSRSLLRQDEKLSIRPATENYCIHDKLVHLRNLVAKIEVDGKQELSIKSTDTAHDSRPNPKRRRAQQGTLDAWEEMRRQHDISVDVLPRALYVDQSIAALVCANSLPGDFIITAGHEDVCLIVRPSTTNKHSYDVMGEALVVNGYRLARETHPAWLNDPRLKDFVNGSVSTLRCVCPTIPNEPPGSFWADTRIRWTPEDAILLAGQDLQPNRGGRDVSRTYARLVTRTLANPIGAVRTTRVVDICERCQKLRKFPDP